MNELIKISTSSNDITLSGRDLHEFLEIGTQYKDWFPRMIEYGFSEGEDFNPLKIEQVQTEGSREVKRNIIDHEIKLDMAKEIAMIQRSEKGKQARKYFLDVEKKWNSPEIIMKRALEIASKQVENLMLENKQKEQVIHELQPKATYYDLILQNSTLLAITVIAKDYGMSGTALNDTLHELGIQYKQSGTWLLYAKYQDKGYTSSKTQNFNRSDGSQGSKLHTYWTQKGRLFIYDLLKQDGILPLIELEEEKQ